MRTKTMTYPMSPDRLDTRLVLQKYCTLNIQHHHTVATSTVRTYTICSQYILTQLQSSSFNAARLQAKSLRAAASEQCCNRLHNAHSISGNASIMRLAAQTNPRLSNNTASAQFAEALLPDCVGQAGLQCAPTPTCSSAHIIIRDRLQSVIQISYLRTAAKACSIQTPARTTR